MSRKIDRLLQYLEYKGITENKATVECGLSNGLIGQAKRGKSDIGEKAAEKILMKYQDLERVWLLTGEGSMLKESSTATAPADSDNISIDRQAGEVIRSQAASLERNDKQMDELLALLREEMKRGEDADYRGHVATRAAAD